MYRNKGSRCPTPRACTRPLSPSGGRKADNSRRGPRWPGGGRLTSRADRGFPAPGNAPSSTVSGQDTAEQRGHSACQPPSCQAPPPASPLDRPLRQAGQHLHGNRTQTTYPGRLGRLQSQVAAGRAKRDRKWAGTGRREGGFRPDPKPLWLALVTVTAAEVQLTLQLSLSSRSREGAAGRSGAGPGEESLGGFPAPPGHWACVGPPQRMRRDAEATGGPRADWVAGGSWARAGGRECEGTA